MLNVESDDYGVLERRHCGCPLDAAGLDLHMHTIRSWEKLTSEGMTLGGADLIRLVEEILPARFGGAPTDWQLVEEEEEGLPEGAHRGEPAARPAGRATRWSAPRSPCSTRRAVVPTAWASAGVPPEP